MQESHRSEGSELGHHGLHCRSFPWGAAFKRVMTSGSLTCPRCGEDQETASRCGSKVLEGPRAARGSSVRAQLCCSPNCGETHPLDDPCKACVPANRIERGEHEV